MRRIISKGFIEQLPELRDMGFDATELQIKSEHDFNKNPHCEGMEIYCMHEFKGSFQIGREKLWGNIGDNHRFGDLSEKLLKEHINYAKQHNIPRLVLHPGFVNTFTSDKEAAMDTVCRRLENIYDPAVKICIENSHFWPNSTAYANERLVVDGNDTSKLFQKANVEMGLAVDIEHLYMAAIFTKFYDELRPLYKDVYRKKICKEDADAQAQDILTDYARDNPYEMEHRTNTFVKEYLTEWKNHIDLLHVCGSDPSHYRTPQHGGHVLKGSHLPINFSGELEATYIKDKVDHQFYHRLLDNDIPAVVEVMDKGMPEGYTFWVARSRDRLAHILARE